MTAAEGRTVTRTERLACREVHHSFDGSPVLEDVTVAATPGDVLAVIGPSGTGKSTLLRVMAMRLRPDAGTVVMDDEDVWAHSGRERLAMRRRVGMVFQEAHLFDTTVGRNVRFGPRVRTNWRARLRAWVGGGSNGATSVREDLELVDLAGFEDREVASLSGGEAQRVSFARAMAYDPDVLLLDEPTSELDPRNTAVLEDAVTTARDTGLAVVIATHDMHQAERLSDRTAVLIDGELVEVGPTAEMFDDPDDARTRRFIDGDPIP